MAKLSASNRPAPFQRPRIDLDSSVRRAWQDVSWQDLTPGDTVADHGTVRDMQENPHGMYYLFDHEQRFVPNTATEKVFAFVRVSG